MKNTKADLKWVVALPTIKPSEVVEPTQSDFDVDKDIVMRVFAKHPGWKPPVPMGRLGIIYDPIIIGKFRYDPEPLILNSISNLTVRKRCEAIINAGAKGTFYMGHELMDDTVKIPIEQIKKTMLYVVGAILALVSAAMALTAAIAVLAVVGSFLIPAILILGLVFGVDPSIVFVTQGEGEWLEVCSYLS